GLLARLHSQSDLSQLLRHIFARAHRHAGVARQRIHRRRDSLRSKRLSAPASSACLVRWLLDLLGLRLPDERVTRPCLSGSDFSFAVDLLSRSTAAISRAFAMGICGDLSFSRHPLAYLGGMAFSQLLSSFSPLGMVGASARAFRRSARLPGNACLSICAHASGLVVSVVDRADGRRDFRLATRNAA